MQAKIFLQRHVIYIEFLNTGLVEPNLVVSNTRILVGRNARVQHTYLQELSGIHRHTYIHTYIHTIHTSKIILHEFSILYTYTCNKCCDPVTYSDASRHLEVLSVAILGNARSGLLSAVRVKLIIVCMYV